MTDPDDAARKQDIADAAFHPEQGIHTCGYCHASVPYLVVPNLKTGELVTIAVEKWDRPDCPVDDPNKPCPFLASSWDDPDDTDG
jgi:hypothetical protein